MPLDLNPLDDRRNDARLFSTVYREIVAERTARRRQTHGDAAADSRQLDEEQTSHTLKGDTTP